MKPTLLTMGYEGLDLPTFLEALDAKKVKVVVDVREVPISRKKGFSKTALSQAVTKKGMDYIHLRDLGSPRKIRKRLYLDGDYEAFFSAYELYLDGQGEALITLRSLIEQNQRVCLLCFEKSHENCHRSRLADRVIEHSPVRISLEPYLHKVLI